jgi:hypothetical protein
MLFEINEKCCVDSDAYQWIAQRKREVAEPMPVAFYRTLGFALDTLVSLELCAEAEITQARAIAAQLESTKQRINDLLAKHRYVPIPDEIAELGDFLTAGDGINYRFLKQVWSAQSPAEIQVLAEQAVFLAEKLTQEGIALPTSRSGGADFGQNTKNPPPAQPKADLSTDGAGK